MDDHLKSEQIENKGEIDIRIIGNNERGTVQCVCCHRKELFFVKIGWMLLCEHCLRRLMHSLLSRIKEEKSWRKRLEKKIQCFIINVRKKLTTRA